MYTKAMKLTLIKKQTFKLKPYGKFFISMARRPKSHLPHVIDFRELRIDFESGMPFTKEQEQKILKEMKKHKTDIFTDGSWNGHYTRAGGGQYASLCRVSHPKISKYQDDVDGFREVIDNTYTK